MGVPRRVWLPMLLVVASLIGAPAGVRATTKLVDPAIGITPSRVAFGPIGVGTSTVRAAFVTSLSDRPLRFNSFSICQRFDGPTKSTCSSFRDTPVIFGIGGKCVATFNQPLQPGESCRLVVAAAAEGVGGVREYVQITEVRLGVVLRLPITARGV